MVYNHGYVNRLSGRVQREKTGFLIKSNETPTCPRCGCSLRKKDWVRRIRKQTGGEAEWMLIERRKCTNDECGKTHRLLPGYAVLPYKHYDAGVIEEAVEGTLDEEALLEDYPSELTIRRWLAWAEELIRNVEGHLRSTAYRVYDLSYEFLNSRISLLEELKRRLDQRWLTTVIRIYIDTGGG